MRAVGVSPECVRAVCAGSSPENDGGGAADMAARMRAEAWSPDIQGLAAGQGWTTHVRPLPACLPAMTSADGVVLVRATGDGADEARTTLRQLAAAVLRGSDAAAVGAEVEALALALDPPADEEPLTAIVAGF